MKLGYLGIIDWSILTKFSDLDKSWHFRCVRGVTNGGGWAHQGDALIQGKFIAL